MGIDPVSLAISTAVSTAISLATSAVLSELQDPIEVGKLDQLSIDTQGEGVGLTIAHGRECIIEGTPIWTNVVEQKSTKRNPIGSDTEKYRYKASMAVAFIDRTTGGVVNEYSKIWAQDRLIYSEDPTVSVVDSALTVTTEDFLGDYMVITSDDADVDLTIFKSNQTITITNFNNAGNNGTFGGVWTERKSATRTVLKCINENAVACGGSCGTDVTIVQTQKKFYNDDVRGVDVTHKGSATQSIPSFITDLEGIGEVEDWRGIGWIGFDRLKLKHYGNRVPKLKALIATSSIDVALKVVVDDVVARAEKEIAERFNDPTFSFNADTDDLTGVVVRGVMFRAPMKPRDMLRKLAVVYNLAVQDTGNGLRFFLRQNAPEVAIDPDHLAAHKLGDDYDRPFSVKQEKNENIPSEVHVRYFDPELDYERGTQTETRQDAQTVNVKIVDLPFVLTADEARAIAAKMLWLAEATQNVIRLQLPLEYAHVLENDVLTWTDPDTGHPWRVLVDKVDHTPEGTIEIEGIEEAAYPLTFTRTGIGGEHLGNEEGEIPSPPLIYLQAWEHGPLYREDATVPTLYFAGCAFDSGANFDGYTLHRSDDLGANYDPVGFIDIEGTMGITDEALDDVPATTATWDNLATLDVTLYDGAPTTATEEEVVIYRRNWFRVGNEVIGVTTITSNGNGSYTLGPGMLRGLLNTEDETGSHAAREAVVSITSDEIGVLPLSTSDVGKTLYFKAVPYEFDGTVADIPIAVNLTFAGETVKPWAPTNIYGVRGAVGYPATGILIKWERRTRAPVSIIGSKPLLEPIERYKVQVLDSAGSGGGSVVGTYIVQNASRLYYSDFQQTNDGLTPGDPVDVIVSQWSDALQDYGDEVAGTAG